MKFSDMSQRELAEIELSHDFQKNRKWLVQAINEENIYMVEKLSQRVEAGDLGEIIYTVVMQLNELKWEQPRNDRAIKKTEEILRILDKAMNDMFD